MELRSKLTYSNIPIVLAYMYGWCELDHIETCGISASVWIFIRILVTFISTDFISKIVKTLLQWAVDRDLWTTASGWRVYLLFSACNYYRTCTYYV